MSRPAIRVAVIGIAVGVLVMLCSLAVVIGFKQAVREQITGFEGHISVVNFSNNSSYQMKPILASDSLCSVLAGLPGVKSACKFCTKPGIIKTDSAFQGVVLKGRTEELFYKRLTAGHAPQEKNEVLLSESLCRLLNLQLGDPFYCYFLGEKVRARRYSVAGTYSTGFAEYDNMFVIAPFDDVAQLCDYGEQEASGIEMQLFDFRQLDEVADEVFFATANRPDAAGNMLYTETIQNQNPAIFSWLNLLDMNVVIILVLMFAVSAFCIISGLIILILDNIRLIGTLKSLGADNRLLRRTFLIEAGFLISKGLVWGNIIGIGLCLIQHYTHLIALDPTSYYVSYVPISLSLTAILLLNAGVVLLSLVVLLAPSAIVQQISPAKVMHFE